MKDTLLSLDREGNISTRFIKVLPKINLLSIDSIRMAIRQIARASWPQPSICRVYPFVEAFLQSALAKAVVNHGWKCDFVSEIHKMCVALTLRPSDKSLRRAAQHGARVDWYTVL
jgi:hypothetical protein